MQEAKRIRKRRHACASQACQRNQRTPRCTPLGQVPAAPSAAWQLPGPAAAAEPRRLVLPAPCRDPYAEGQLRRVRCQLKTTGGNCAQLVQQNIGHLLLRLGLPPYFYFDGDQFRPKAPPKPHVAPKPRPAAAGGRPLHPRCRVCSLRRRASLPCRVTPCSRLSGDLLSWAPAGLCWRAAPKAAPPGPEKVEAVRARAAAAGFPSQTISEEQFRDMQAQSVWQGAGLDAGAANGQ